MLKFGIWKRPKVIFYGWLPSFYLWPITCKFTTKSPFWCRELVMLLFTVWLSADYPLLCIANTELTIFVTYSCSTLDSIISQVSYSLAQRPSVWNIIISFNFIKYEDIPQYTWLLYVEIFYAFTNKNGPVRRHIHPSHDKDML